MSVTLYVFKGNSPSDTARQPRATVFQSFSALQGRGAQAWQGTANPPSYYSPCPGATTLTHWYGAPRVCPPLCLATGRAACHTGEQASWPRLTHLIGIVGSCRVCVCGSIQALDNIWKLHDDMRRMD